MKIRHLPCQPQLLSAYPYHNKEDTARRKKTEKKDSRKKSKWGKESPYQKRNIMLQADYIVRWPGKVRKKTVSFIPHSYDRGLLTQ